jgi:hypothetical protein
MGLALCICVTRGKGMLRTNIYAQTHLWWVFGSMVPADAPTAKHPGLCLGYTFINEWPKAGVLGGHPLGGESPFQATPRFFDDKHVHPKKLTELPHLHCCHANLARRLVLNVLGKCLKVRHGQVAQGILVEFVVKCLAGGHPLWRRR